MPCQILVVDDDPDILFGLRRTLSGPATEVSTAGSRADAEDLLGRLSTDVLVADLMLSGSDPEEGLAMVRAARARLPGLKVVVITACGEPDIEARAVDAGAHILLQKPISTTRLRDAMRTLGVES